MTGEVRRQAWMRIRRMVGPSNVDTWHCQGGCFTPGRPADELRLLNRLVKTWKSPGQALKGIRVIDFTHDQAGPSCTQMLAWLGADVIKIERPPHGDRARRLWNIDNPDLDSFFFLLLNSNKRSTVVNLRAEEGKEIARRVRPADAA